MVPDADGTPCDFYWSDRCPETLGRGGFLIHPFVEGIKEAFPAMPVWNLGNWENLRVLIDLWLDNDLERRARAEENRARVLNTATYEVRMRELVALMKDRGMA